MKKIFTLIVVSIFFNFISCTNSIENKIKSEFEVYVENNFDNPTNLKEIIGITIKDTISSNKLVADIKKKKETIIRNECQI